jgi:tetratricopeptide (TPR) repeat protein
MKTIDFSYFIERYNAGEMNEAEKLWFEKELEGNSKLREEVLLRKKTDLALKNHRSMELRNKLKEIEKRRAAAVPVKSHKKNITLRYAAIITGVILISSIFLIKDRNLTSDEVIEKYYKPYEVISATRSFMSTANNDFLTATDYYNIHDFKNAALYFSKVLSNDPKYMEATMYKGVSNYEIKNYPVAEQEFIKVLGDNNNLFMEDAQWYLALCYIKTGDKDRAVQQLAMIKNSESLYRKDARQILKRMK